ncbi:glycosyltransferase [Lachnospiraceae bacterium]|nr:glycosyltransferase [Lachnospiraceae bacterium]
MEKKNIFNAVGKTIYRIRQRMEMKKVNSQKWSVEYAEEHFRRIQICIGGLADEKLEEVVREYKEATAVLGDAILITDIKKEENGYETYYYSPESEPLEGVQIFQVAYLLMNSFYDYVIVSKSFAEFPLIGCKRVEDVLLYAKSLDIHDDTSIKKAVGRYMRLPAFQVEKHTINLKDALADVELQQEYYLTDNIGFIPRFTQYKREFCFEKKKEVVFVDPIFLAVGGVERNTIEIMRALKDDYMFCMITMERHSESQGSLHFQLKGICDYIIDLREITEFDHYLACLQELKQIFSPDVLWLCNNSPWFERNTLHIREIFKDVAMVAQDVYDTKVGWIEYYRNPEMLLFDRYIAVTELIRETFVKKYKIPEDKIDVIYSVIDGTRIKKELDNHQERDVICEEYGLKKDKKLFAFVGRLTEQKDPIRFLKLAEQAKEHKMEDACFIMVGDGAVRDEVEAYIAEKELHDYVLRIPYVENTPRFISILDGLILTSVYEGMPIVSIEAMCMSTPIFSTDTGDLKRFLVRNGNGWIIDEKRSDYENFKEFCGKIPEYKKNASISAMEMLEFFSAVQVAQAYRKTFEKGIYQRKGKDSHSC